MQESLPLYLMENVLIVIAVFLFEFCYSLLISIASFIVSMMLHEKYEELMRQI